ncbi:MAG: pyridoxamine 5'-phosphate oxidase, partial [Candidimonas sp.]
HTGNLQARPDVSLLVAQPEVPGEPVHALPRVTLQGRATTPEVGSEEWQACKSAYLARFPEAESMTKLNDFRFVAITATRGRHVDGFGMARNVHDDEIVSILST